jgi:hypothetical protein
MKRLWKALKRGSDHRWYTSLTQAYKNIFPDEISASIPAVPTVEVA